MGLFRFSVNEARDETSAQSFRDVYEPMMNLFVDRVNETPMSADLTVRVLAGVGVGGFVTTPLRGTRTASHIAADGNDDLNIGICRSGRAGFQQKGRVEATISPGTAYLWDSDRPGVNYAPEKVSMINISLPRSLIAPQIADIDRVFRDGLPATAGLRLLATYASCLASDIGPMTPQEEATAALHLRDLAALVLGTDPETDQVARDRGVRAARLRAIKDDIGSNLAEEGLSLEAVARRHGISPRYVRALFELEHTSFTEYVLNARLTRAHRMLTDPRSVHIGIGTVAFDVGFNDLSYFGRAFRRRFGMTPSEARATLAEQ